MAILKAYLDDSGDPDGGHNFLTVGGYVATVDYWEYFEKQWTEILDEFRVPYFHMKEFWNANGIYKNIKKEKNREREFIEASILIIKATAEICVSVTVKLADLVIFNKRHKLDLDPYSLAIYGCLIHMIFCPYSSPRFAVDIAEVRQGWRT